MAISRFGKDDFGSTPSATIAILRGMSIMSISIRSNMDWHSVYAIGLIHRFIAMSGKARCPRIGPAMSARRKQILVSRPAAVVCRSPHERSDMRGAVRSEASPGYRFAHPGYACCERRDPFHHALRARHPIAYPGRAAVRSTASQSRDPPTPGWLQLRSPDGAKRNPGGIQMLARWAPPDCASLHPDLHVLHWRSRFSLACGALR